MSFRKINLGTPPKFEIDIFRSCRSLISPVNKSTFFVDLLSDACSIKMDLDSAICCSSCVVMLSQQLICQIPSAAKMLDSEVVNFPRHLGTSGVMVRGGNKSCLEDPTICRSISVLLLLHLDQDPCTDPRRNLKGLIRKACTLFSLFPDPCLCVPAGSEPASCLNSPVTDVCFLPP
jgi:hypothetical protein